MLLSWIGGEGVTRVFLHHLFMNTIFTTTKQALRLESQEETNAHCADTNLNMCTILSELKRHEQAIVHARTALKVSSPTNRLQKKKRPHLHRHT